MLKPPHDHTCGKCGKKYQHKNGECRAFDEGWCGCLAEEEWMLEVAPTLCVFRTMAMQLAERMIDRRRVY